MYNVDSIKVEFVNYRCPLLRPFVEKSGLRLVSPEDIAAMKLSAIAGRGSKKDFIDLYLLLNHFTLREMMDFYLEKFPDGSQFLAVRSLVYFDDAENEAAPRMFVDVSWEEIKLRILEEVNKL